MPNARRTLSPAPRPTKVLRRMVAAESRGGAGSRRRGHTQIFGGVPPSPSLPPVPNISGSHPTHPTSSGRLGSQWDQKKNKTQPPKSLTVNGDDDVIGVNGGDVIGDAAPIAPR